MKKAAVTVRTVFVVSVAMKIFHLLRSAARTTTISTRQTVAKVSSQN